jgi:membrane complex biogenesis BtpA family protein
VSERFRPQDLFGVNRPVLGGMLMPPLLGAPRYGGSMTNVIDRVLEDAHALAEAGVHALTLENVGDNPFVRDDAPAETVAAFTMVAHETRRALSLPLGINVMRNSWRAAMGIAAAVDAQYVRINVLGDVLATDQGIIQGCAADLLRYRRALGADHIKIFGDVDCKHAGPLTHRPLDILARDTAYRQMADALLVTGPDSDTPPTLEDIETVKGAVPDVPVFMASGMSIDSVALVGACDGTTIGTYARNWNIDGPVQRELVTGFVKAVSEL